MSRGLASKLWRVPIDANILVFGMCQLVFTYHVSGMCLSCSAADQRTEVVSVLRKTSFQDHNSAFGKFLFSSVVSLSRNTLAAQDGISFGDLPRL